MDYLQYDQRQFEQVGQSESKKIKFDFIGAAFVQCCSVSALRQTPNNPAWIMILAILWIGLMVELLHSETQASTFDALGGTHKVIANAILRYEDETDHINIADRERMRLIAHGGIQSKWHQQWRTQIRFRTGLKNKQNVPAITVYKFNDQPQPDNDVFIDRFFVQGKFDDVTVKAGKIPLQPHQVTDIFWDHHLNPIGLSVNYRVSQSHTFYMARVKPLDGASSTVGDMTVLQWQVNWQVNDWQFGLSPWWVDYRGEEGARYAKNDTALDNQFVRISSYVKTGKWQLGFDWGRSLNRAADFSVRDFQDQTSSYAVELKYGGLKHPGDYLTHFRVFKVERFGVITEFAQNATARFATSNMEGWDIRVRRKMAENWWLGTRLSDLQRLKGNLEQGKRFRIEAMYRF